MEIADLVSTSQKPAAQMSTSATRSTCAVESMHPAIAAAADAPRAAAKYIAYNETIACLKL